MSDAPPIYPAEYIEFRIAAQALEAAKQAFEAAQKRYVEAIKTMSELAVMTKPAAATAADNADLPEAPRAA